MNLYMNIGISNWNNWSFDPTKMMFLTLFPFLSRLLTSNHPKLFSTYLVERTGAMWKTCFSAPQNAKKENQLKHKNHYKSRCPTINLQFSILPKWLAKHISTKVPSKLLLGKDMFTLTYVNLEYETSICIWEFEMIFVVLPSFQLPKRLNSQNTKKLIL